MTRRRWLRTAVAAAAAVGVARAQSLQDKRKIAIAVGGKTALYCLPLAVAEQLNYFSDEGLDVELLDHAGGSLAQQSMLQGRADVALGGLEHAILLRQRGYSCRAFVFLGRAPQVVFGANPRVVPDARALAQLKGHRIGVSAPDSLTHWFAQMLLARHGLLPTDVEYVGVGTSTAAASAVREGRVDAISSIDPVISMLEFRGDIRVLADTRSLRGTQDLYGGPMPGACLYAPQAFVVRYAPTVQALTHAVVRALKWLQTAGPSDIVRAVPEAYMYGDRAIYLAALEKAREALSPDGMVSEEGVAVAHRIVSQYFPSGGTVRAQSPGATYTNDFARRAKQRFQVSGIGAGTPAG
ncbi:ABC transporter substrate-binding protein [Ottowia sp.]|uniref:ABC transporter substrate-binding protein n=1 Tax=Ottowia sp. TaxID=1898956 RepID=UPI002B9C46E4|nr:ABC transporter substrate-binding protein [Ottowia sp.]HOB65314.1 ABC transporter substrate-binding protein [Ottowia sp.]HPZ58479.1 ABC transporter substrate-binding protein [Ottowia sp.]HQD47210.1 ABC transporter substrate-binding protein [Ottowia sp.]